jgi:RNA polymerase sigma-70 factor, ECF subfamily
VLKTRLSPTGVAQYLPFVTSFVRKLMRYDQFAEDRVQQTVLKAIYNAYQFRFESALKTWLTAIAVNEVRQAYRSNQRAIPLLTEGPSVYRSIRVAFQENCYEAKERDMLVRHAVSRLPQIYRSVIELCDLQCLPLKQAARELGLTLSAIKSRRHPALNKLRLLMAEMNRR